MTSQHGSSQAGTRQTPILEYLGRDPTLWERRLPAPACVMWGRVKGRETGQGLPPPSLPPPPHQAMPFHALRGNLFCTKKDFKQHLTVNERRPGVQKKKHLKKKNPTTQTPAYNQDWKSPLRLQLQLVRQFEISMWLVYPTQAGSGAWAGAEGDPPLHIIIQGPRLMEVPPRATQFWVLHGRVGGAYSSSLRVGEITAPHG